jgi:filamentous hemagglutinin
MKQNTVSTQEKIPYSSLMSLIRILILLLIFIAPTRFLTAQVTPDAAAPSTHKPTVSTVSSVPVVTITAPGAGGISWNQYTQFNVGAPGLVFNNALTGAPSVLTGTTLPANPNFTGSAALVILNEVTSTQSSNLSGAMEIAGQTASLIIANPNGITINGASTLNTSRLTLTTGIPSLDASNKLNLQVQQGTLKIGPGGLNTSTAAGTELIAEKVQLEGPTQAGNGELTIQGGKQTYHWNDKTMTASTSAGTGYAIDGTALGAAQAGSIKIIATQSGVGVRTPGNLASTTGDITLDAQGNIVVSQAKAKRDVKIKSTASAVTMQGTIQADRDVVFFLNKISPSKPPSPLSAISASPQMSRQISKASSMLEVQLKP